MKIDFDRAADALYIRLDDADIDSTVEARAGVHLDLDAKGRVIGIEVLDVMRMLPGADLTKIDFRAA
jgi:uncharacterized protein YuzE